MFSLPIHKIFSFLILDKAAQDLPGFVKRLYGTKSGWKTQVLPDLRSFEWWQQKSIDFRRIFRVFSLPIHKIFSCLMLHKAVWDLSGCVKRLYGTKSGRKTQIYPILEALNWGKVEKLSKFMDKLSYFLKHFKDFGKIVGSIAAQDLSGSVKRLYGTKSCQKIRVVPALRSFDWRRQQKSMDL